MNVAMASSVKGVEYSCKAGWPAIILSEANNSAALEVDGFEVKVVHDVERNIVELKSELPCLNVQLPTTWEAALLAIENAYPGASGHAVVLAPVGSYLSPVKIGAIDSVIFSNITPQSDWLRDAWALSCVSISHTRCWLVNIIGSRNRKPEVDSFARRSVVPSKMVNPPAMLKIADTATLSEFARDCGWSDAYFPDIVLLGKADNTCATDKEFNVWLAVTDAVVAFVLAYQIGTYYQPDLQRETRYEILHESLKTPLRGQP
jgi:hypothetical protein